MTKVMGYLLRLACYVWDYLLLLIDTYTPDRDGRRLWKVCSSSTEPRGLYAARPRY